jgi:hypothetical protein
LKRLTLRLKTIEAAYDEPNSFHSSDFKLKEIMSWSLIQKRYQKRKLWKIDSFKE